MPADDYSAAVSGGLKLKGVNTSSKISKHRKKKAKLEADPAAQNSKDATTTQKLDAGAEERSAERAIPNEGEAGDEIGEGSHDADAAPPPQRAGKTEAELRHEERRRKRVRSTEIPYAHCPEYSVRWC